MSQPYHLLGFLRRPDEHFDTLRELALRIHELLRADRAWFGDGHVVIGVMDGADRVERHAVFVRHTDAAGAPGELIGIAILPIDPVTGSFGGRPALITALKRSIPQEHTT